MEAPVPPQVRQPTILERLGKFVPRTPGQKLAAASLLTGIFEIVKYPNIATAKASGLMAGTSPPDGGVDFGQMANTLMNQANEIWEKFSQLPPAERSLVVVGAGSIGGIVLLTLKKRQAVPGIKYDRIHYKTAENLARNKAEVAAAQADETQFQIDVGTKAGRAQARKYEKEQKQLLKEEENKARRRRNLPTR